MEWIADNLSVNENGHLCFAGVDTVALAQKYGTPLYIMDEEKIRKNCRIYTEAFKKCFRPGSQVIFASKACAFKEMYRIVESEGMCAEVVSSGELYTALAAGFPAEKMLFHGSNKTDRDIAYAIESGIGCFAVDNAEELEAVARKAEKRGIVQPVLLRLTPGIDPHTYEAISTGKIDSKFGIAIETGAAEAVTRRALALKNIKLLGFHCHVGSEVFAEDVFERSAEVMLRFMADMLEKTGYTADVLDLGGGYGVRYVATDPHVDIAAKIASVAQTIKTVCAALGYPEPTIRMEPGRSIVADAGMTLYEAGTVKIIPDIKTYVSVDGGMADDPRYALYGARYTVLSASRVTEPHTMCCSVVGRCCESGDIIQENVLLPEATTRGDILAVCTTGAYNYSMASNYNRLPRPAVVMLDHGTDRIVVRAETFEDLVRLDV